MQVNSAGMRIRALWTLAVLVSLPPVWLSTGRLTGGFQVASAFYVEQAAQVAKALDEFVEALLKKVSLLSVVVVEWSLKEECKLDTNFCNNTKQLENSSDLFNLQQDELDDLDLRSYKDLGSTFIKKNLLTFEEMLTNQTKQVGSCKFFNFPISKQDLPIEEMDSCCELHQFCYLTCKQEKLYCDQQFRQCLKDTCKSKQLNNTTNELEEEQNKRDKRKSRDQYKQCRLAERILLIGSLAFGCHSFGQAQKFACCK